MNDLNPIVKKLIESNAISLDEWSVLLNEWDESNRIQWVKPYDDNDNLLSLWCKKNIPIEVVERLSSKYGKELWDQAYQNETIFDVLVRRSSDKHRDDFDTYFKTFFDIFDVEKVWASAKKNSDIQRQWFSDAPTNFAMALFSLSKDAQGTLRYILQNNKDLLVSEHKGKYIADILTSNETTFHQYTNAGGSLFFEINGKPLWQHLMHKKIYHNGLKNALEAGMTRMLEQSSPQDTEVTFSDEDWNKLQEQKHLILQERTVFEFERDLKSNWRSALKSNKDWRKWVNAEGANVMHWLALNDGEFFVRSAVNKKINEPLIVSADSNNNDTLIYFLLGTTKIISNMTGRRASKFVSENFPDFWDKYLPLCNQNPEKGVIPTFIDATPDDFFKSTESLPNASYADDIRNSLFKKLPNTNIMLNGMTTEHWIKLLKSPKKMQRSQDFLESYWRISIPHSQWNTLLGNDDKILFMRLMLSQSFYQYLDTDKRSTLNAMISEITNFTPDDYALPLPIMELLAKNPRSYLPYHNTDNNVAFQNWLDKQVLLKSIEITNTEDNEPVVRKRRM